MVALIRMASSMIWQNYIAWRISNENIIKVNCSYSNATRDDDWLMLSHLISAHDSWLCGWSRQRILIKSNRYANTKPPWTLDKARLYINHAHRTSDLVTERMVIITLIYDIVTTTYVFIYLWIKIWHIATGFTILVTSKWVHIWAGSTNGLIWELSN